jgi:hypothetical protein
LRDTFIVTADCLNLLEIRAVEFIKFGLVRSGIVTENGAEVLPEDLFIGHTAIVFDHGGSATPNGLDELLGLVSMGSQFGGKAAKVGLYKHILIHG